MKATYKAVELSEPGNFSEVRKPLVDPGPNQVRIQVEACGVCHSDAATVDRGQRRIFNLPLVRNSCERRHMSSSRSIGDENGKNI
jgi:D-arabinose 1-dehydrogenase-like Zn-dependent alcohol dehydrogenase